MKKIDDLVVKDQHDQTTIILLCKQACPHAAIRNPAGPAAPSFRTGSLGGRKQQKKGRPTSLADYTMGPRPRAYQRGDHHRAVDEKTRARAASQNHATMPHRVSHPCQPSRPTLLTAKQGEVGAPSSPTPADFLPATRLGGGEDW
jgi:hypothetical protein